MNVRTVLIGCLLALLSSTGQVHANPSVTCSVTDPGGNVTGSWTASLSSSVPVYDRELKVKCQEASPIPSHSFPSSIYLCFKAVAANGNTEDGPALTGGKDPNHSLSYMLKDSNGLELSANAATPLVSVPLTLTSGGADVEFLYRFSLKEGQENSVVPDTYSGAWQFLIHPSPAQDCSENFSSPILTQRIQASIQVLSSCDLKARPLNFPPTFAGTGTVVTAESSLQVRCTSGTNYVISMNDGLHATDLGVRHLKHILKDERIRYEISQDSNQKVGENYIRRGTGVFDDVTVYGRAFPTSGNSVGIYEDTVIVTLTY